MCNKHFYCLLSAIALSFSGLVVGQEANTSPPLPYTPPSMAPSQVVTPPIPPASTPPQATIFKPTPVSPSSLGLGVGTNVGGQPAFGTIPSSVPSPVMRVQTGVVPQQQITSLVSGAVETATKGTDSVAIQKAVKVLSVALKDLRFGGLTPLDQQKIIAALKQTPQAVLQAAMKDILEGIAGANINAQNAGNVPLQRQLNGLQKQLQPQLQKGQKGKKPAGEGKDKLYTGKVYDQRIYVDEAGKKHELYEDYTGGRY